MGRFNYELEQGAQRRKVTGTGVSEVELMNQNQNREEERKALPSGRMFYIIGLIFIILNILVLTPVILIRLYDMQHDAY